MSIDFDKSIAKLVEILKIEDSANAEVIEQEEKISLDNYRIDIHNPKEGDEIWKGIAKMHSKQSLYIRKNSSFLAAAGTSQIVLRLDDTTLVKSVYARGERNKLSHYVLMNGYEPGRIKAERILKELGLNVPNHIYVSNNPEPNSGVWGKERYDFRLLDDELYEGYHGSALFLLTKDLTENGKYVVKEFEENTLNNIDNKKQLMEEYKAFYNILYNIRFQDNSNNKYLLTGNGHTMESGDISGAINHLFLLKINPNTNIGELVAEDTNHIDIWCNPKFKS